MATRIDRDIYGWLVWDRRFGTDYLAANDGGALESDYAETTPRPGPATLTSGVDMATIRATGALDESIDIEATTAGMPGRDSARVIIRGEDDVWLTWNPTSFERWWIGKENTGNLEAFSCGTDRWTGNPVFGWSNNGSFSAVYWDGLGGATPMSASTGESGDGSEGIAFVSIPRVGSPRWRLLALLYDGTQMSVQYSDDAGATWADYASDVMVSGVPSKTTSRMTAAYADGAICLILEAADGSGDLYQLASEDLGVTFRTVASQSSQGTDVQLMGLPTGGFAAVYDRSGGNGVLCTRFGSAYVALEDGDEVVLDSDTATDACTAWVESDGTIYALVIDGTTWQTYRSVDAGATFDEAGLLASQLFNAAGGNQHPKSMYACGSAHGAFVLHSWDASVTASNREDSMGVMQLGGWSTRERLYGADEWAPAPGGTGCDWGLYLPFETTGNLGFTTAGAGAETLDSEGITFTGVFSTYLDSNGNDDGAVYAGFVDCICTAGGAVTAGNQIFTFDLDHADEGYKITLRVGTAGWRVVDNRNSNATLASGTVDMTTTRMQFIIAPGGVQYREVGSTAWSTATYTATAPGSGVGPAGVRVTYASIQASADVTVYGMGVQLVSADTPAVTSAIDYIKTSSTGYRGRPIGGAGWWHPFTDAGRLAMVDGPTIDGDAWTVDPTYDYSVRNALVDTGPSPYREWKSGVETEQVICWDFGEITRRKWVGLYVERPRFRTAMLERYDPGSTSWVTEVSIDLGAELDGVDYLLEGNSLVPANTPTTNGDRYIQSGELTGGYVILPSSKCRVISGNTGGGWDDSASGAPRPVIYLDGIDGTESASGTCVIVPPRGFELGYCSDSSPGSRYWRVRVPAQQAPGNSIGAGLIMPGWLHAVGAEPDWAWADEPVHSVSRQVSPQGTPRAEQLAPPRRVWSWGWSDGVDMYGLRDSVQPDYLRPDTSGADALVGYGDVWWQLDGLAEMTESGALPVVAVRVMPSEGTTITDRSRLLYCYVDTWPTTTGLAGVEGSGEAVRVGSMAMREIK